ncbi:hypothetical protein PVAND_012902 [Polypedilum vanderplanki]|uniref:Transportin-3 n=1 Tax=Polypedilum vanderplanki TaxID=319348 RepID=A0A9J6CNT6_POLVA|nr:hypothetical protein PVAND_012902 [Polypedilum vanderplanki]
MEEEPKIEDVLNKIYDLYCNPDISKKDPASKYLASLQDSIYSWKISDQLLQQKNDMHSCYYAAQTLRSKIQHSFHELHESDYISLRDSIIAHIEHITPDTNPTIAKQLCLALADLLLLMASWMKPVDDLIKKFSQKTDSIQPLLMLLTFIPEELDARYLRIGENRRKQILNELDTSSPIILSFLQSCLMINDTSILQHIYVDVIQCFTAWVKMDCINLTDAAVSPVFSYAFKILTSPPSTTDEKQLEVASDCVCAILEAIVLERTTEEIEKNIFLGVLQLEHAYNEAVAQEDVDKCMVLCRIFTVMAETFLPRIVNSSTPSNPHYTIKALDVLIMCVGHYDFELAQITFSVWYKLSEELYQKNDDNHTAIFENHIERLIEALFKHCQLDADHEGLINEEDTFGEFRYKVSELIKDVSFIVRSKSCFQHMFNVLQNPNVTWEATEAALFIMECVARNLDVKEDKIVPKVLEAILNLPDSCHVAIRFTSVNMLGQLCDWISAHPTTLEAVLNFLLGALQKKAGLASAAAQSLQLICSSCHKDMINHISGLLEIARCLEMFEVQPNAAIALLKGISQTVSRLPNDQITEVMRQLCAFQIAHLCMLMENEDKKDPTQWIDRLAAIYRYMNPRVCENEPNPATAVIIENWPVLSRMLDYYKQNEKIIERIVRCIRYGIRCISHESLPILDSLVTQMVNVYSSQKHSCLLYLGSILVDEFGNDVRCISGLLSMLEAFIEPTFNLLQTENGLKNNPDTVDDFFRIVVRFIQRMPLQFLQSQLVTPIIQCATLACSLDHRDANMSVMKFLSNLLVHGKINGDATIRPFVQNIVQAHGETLIVNLIYSSVFYLHPNMLADVVDVLMEIKFISNEIFADALKKALNQLPRKNAGGSETATEEQLSKFFQNITKTNISVRQMTHELQDFCRLFR